LRDYAEGFAIGIHHANAPLTETTSTSRFNTCPTASVANETRKIATKQLFPTTLFLLTGFGMTLDAVSSNRSIYAQGKFQVIIEL
jgi:hypothetical protein